MREAKESNPIGDSLQLMATNSCSFIFKSLVRKETPGDGVGAKIPFLLDETLLRQEEKKKFPVNFRLLFYSFRFISQELNTQNKMLWCWCVDIVTISRRNEIASFSHVRKAIF